MKVLVLGATGYVGQEVAGAFRRAGYEVYGLTRSPEKGRRLERDEIHPVIGDLGRPESYRAAAEACDVLVQAAMDYQHDTEALDRLAVATLLEVAHAVGQPRTIVYTGGSWDYGDTAGRTVDETAPVHPVRATAWRPEVERQLLASSGAGLRTVVIRPGNVYGRVGGLTALWFAAATGSGPFHVVAGDDHWPMVHVDDLADGYLRAAESGFTAEIFNLVDGSRPTVRAMVQAVAEAAGYRGEIQFLSRAEAERTMGPMAEPLALDLVVDASKADRLLGWHPRHPGFLADVPTYLAAWKAAQPER